MKLLLFLVPRRIPSAPMASDPSSFLSPSTIFSAPSSTSLWLSLLPHILVIVVTASIVFWCCYRFDIPSRGRISRRRSDSESGFPSRAIPRVAGVVASTTLQYDGEEPVGRNTECCVCLDDFKNGDLCRMLSTCGHCFHEPCINQWLKMSSHCPLCRVSFRRKLRTGRTQMDERRFSTDSTGEAPV